MTPSCAGPARNDVHVVAIVHPWSWCKGAHYTPPDVFALCRRDR